MSTSVTQHGSFTLVTTTMPKGDHAKELLEHEELLKFVTKHTLTNFIKAFTIVNTANDELIHTAYCGVDATPATV
jgi:hypothetical protein